MENPNFLGQALESDRIVTSRLLPGPAIVRFGTTETMIIFPQTGAHRVFFVNADFVSGNGRVAESLILGHDRVTIGRQNQDVPLHHNFSSRKHAEVRFENGKYSIDDVGSSFGTFVADIQPCLPEDSTIPEGEWRSVPLSTDVRLLNHDRSHRLEANFRRKNGKVFISPVLVRRDAHPLEDYNGEMEVPEGVVFKVGFDDTFRGVTNLPNPTTGNSDAHELMAFASFMRVGETLLIRNDTNMNDYLSDKTLSVATENLKRKEPVKSLPVYREPDIPDLKEVPTEFSAGFATASREGQQNEDAGLLYSQNGAVVAGVCDGVSTSNGAREASRMAAVLTRKILRKFDLRTITEDDLIQRVLPEIDARMEEARERGERVGITTASFAILRRSPDNRHYQCLFANVGDSRVYLVDPSGHLRQRSLDDSKVTGIVDSNDVPIPGKENEYYGNRSIITNWLGMVSKDRKERPLIKGKHSGSFNMYEGEGVLITTDGITDNKTKPEIEYTIGLAMPNPRRVTAAIVDDVKRLVLSGNGKDDDMSVAMLRVN